jgi:transposase
MNNLCEKIFKDRLPILIGLINSFKTAKRPYNIDNLYCLEQICYVLYTGISWNALRDLKCHYTTIYKRFLHWTKLKIFEKFWDIIITEYIDVQLFLDPLHFKTVFIDCSMIKNNHGRECTGPNHMDRFRESTKLSMICDNNKVPLVAEFFKGNVADSSTVEETLASLKMLRVNNKYNNVIVGDKGYLLKQQRLDYIYDYGKIRLLAKHRKNQKTKLKAKDIKHFKNRYKIENVFCRLDKFPRIKYRNESSIECYKSYNYIAMIAITLPFL